MSGGRARAAGGRAPQQHAGRRREPEADPWRRPRALRRTHKPYEADALCFFFWIVLSLTLEGFLYNIVCSSWSGTVRACNPSINACVFE